MREALEYYDECGLVEAETRDQLSKAIQETLDWPDMHPMAEADEFEAKAQELKEAATHMITRGTELSAARRQAEKAKKARRRRA